MSETIPYDSLGNAPRIITEVLNDFRSGDVTVDDLLTFEYLEQAAQDLLFLSQAMISGYYKAQRLRAQDRASFIEITRRLNEVA
ncbi:hypothetical protein ABT282_30875 [Streptomyces sp. NPDC000927]|uniref:hypothetical protein n=1 Tax=Streptomyces sp. NPDC000927 TaxID=3154371 RepID=UPI00332BE5C7